MPGRRIVVDSIYDITEQALQEIALWLESRGLSIPFSQVGTGTPAPSNASYVLIANNGTLTADRRLVAGSGIGIVDGGANGDVTISASGGAAGSEPYVTIGNTAGLSAERALTAGDNIQLTDGGANAIATLKANVSVAKAGSAVGTRKRINFIDGTGITITPVDDAGGDEIDVTIAAGAASVAGGADHLFLSRHVCRR
jgi:hypothetical protein